MTQPSKPDVLPTTSNKYLIRLAIALGLALICWPTALYALHGFFFRSGEASGNGRIIFAVVVSLIAIVSTWMAVYLLSSGDE